jgi:hypothetical protein
VASPIPFRRAKPVRDLLCKSDAESVGKPVDDTVEAVDCLLAVPPRARTQHLNSFPFWIFVDQPSKSARQDRLSRANLAYHRQASLRTRDEDSFILKFLSDPRLLSFHRPHAGRPSIFRTDVVLLRIQPLRPSSHASVRSDRPYSPRTALPARYPPVGVWPAMMRADMAAAYLDFENTAELTRAIRQGKAPPPVSRRGKGRLRQPVWSKAILDHFAAPIGTKDAKEPEDLVCLV